MEYGSKSSHAIYKSIYVQTDQIWLRSSQIETLNYSI